MRQLSIGQGLRTGLLVLAVAGLLVTALGVGAVLRARADYEDVVTLTSRLETSSSRLLAAGVIEEAALRAGPGAPAEARRSAARRFATEARRATRLAADDPVSRGLVQRRIVLQERLRDTSRGRDDARITPLLLAGRRISAALDARQVAVREQARVETRERTRSALTRAAIGSGVLAVGAVVLVGLLASAMRRPLHRLETAGRRWTDGHLHERVPEEGPRELKGLAAVFNVMASRLGQARDAVEAERRKLVTVVESLGEGLVVCDREGNVVLLNPRATELVPGLTPDGNAGDEGWPLPADAAALAGEVELEVAGRTLAVTAARLGGELGGDVYVLRDISERARLARLKGEFVATASHELRSPLTSVKGYLELVADAEGLTEDEREFLDVAVQNTDRLADLVEDLLDAATIDSGQLRLKRRTVDLGAVADEVAVLLAPRLDAKGQTLVVERSDGARPAFADPGRVRQILLNLTTNAHLYTGEGGRITLQVGDDDEAAAVTVADTGRGMSPEEVENIFERFFRGSMSNTNTRGTGLGMGIVQSLVEAHGGTIDVRSRLGVGSEFTVRLPLAPQAVPGPDLGVIAGRRVLVVDDEVDVAELLAAQLHRLGAEVRLAHSGEAALEQLRAERFDAMTLDHMLPGRSGLAVLAEVRADPGLRELPVVMVSAYLTPGATDAPVVAKPVDVGALARALAGVLSGGRVRVLAVCRTQVRDALEPRMSAAGLDCQWAHSVPDGRTGVHDDELQVVLIDSGLEGAAELAETMHSGGPCTVFVLDSRDGAPVRHVPRVAVEDAAAVLLGTFFVGRAHPQRGRRTTTRERT